jgi:hypothetical protein
MRPRSLGPVLSLVPFALGFGLGCAHQPGSYDNPKRQLIYDEAVKSGSCGRACCEYGRADHGLSPNWNSREQTCSRNGQPEWNLACVDWCKRETKLER